MTVDDTCAKCLAPVRHVTTVGGTRVVVDEVPTADGVVVIATVGGRVRARVLTGEHLPTQGVFAHRFHRCPLCEVCTKPVNWILLDRLGWTTHPGC